MVKKKLGFDKVTLLKRDNMSSHAEHYEAPSSRDVAIIGMSLQMPQANNPDAFWQNIRDKVDSVRLPSASRQKQAKRYAAVAYGTDYQAKFYKGACLDNIDSFDYRFFNLSPREASLMDPNQRLFLQTVFSAIEDAGYDGRKLAGSRTGIYVGYGDDGEYSRMLQLLEPDAMSVALAGNIRSIIASRISYLLDLKGPSMLIDTACSSSLVAIHQACQSLRAGECDMAIAGSVKTYILPLDTSQRIGIESSDGRTRSFDDYSDGTGPGEGVAALILKPLPQAVRDGDAIYAIIKGSAVNQDGSSIGITSPNVLSQEDVLIQAWRDAGIEPQSIGYLEGHGSGTELGDPIEVDAIQRAFRRYTDKNQFCALGSIKSNIGHLDHAAGIAGVIKAVLALKHKELPPNLHFDKPNARIDFIRSPVYVNDRVKHWPRDATPRRCGVSSFGMSGTNCHIVLQEAPEPGSTSYPEREELLLLSAKTREALLHLVKRYTAFLHEHAPIPLTEICYTANTGRIHHPWRLAVRCSSISDLQSKLGSIEAHGLKHRPEHGLYCGMVEEADAKDSIYPADRALPELAELFVKGGEVIWEACYPFHVNKRNLPTYPFEASSCWLNLPVLPEEQKFHTLKWTQEQLPAAANKSDMGTVLAIVDKSGFGAKLVKKWRSKGRRVIEVEAIPDIHNMKLNDYRYVIDGSEEGYRFVLKSVEAERLTKIVHMGCLDCDNHPRSLAELENTLHAGLYSLFYFVKSLAVQQRSQPIELILTARYAQEVNQLEPQIYPEHAALFGLGKVVGLENPQLKCRAVDWDDETPLAAILQELEASPDSYHVAYRGGERYAEQFAPLLPEEEQDVPLQMHTDGIYVITGGTGGIGLETAKYFAAKAPINLALLNRTPLPDRSQWPSILTDASQTSTARKIAAIMEIEQLGAKVHPYSADVADYEAMRELFAALRAKHGSIRGIVHGAAVGGAGFLLNRQEAKFCEVVRPKIQGTWILDECTQHDQLDFFILYSSATTLTGGLGEGDYTAANAYLDAFQAYRNRQGKRTQTINWVSWAETGMSYEHGVADDDLFEKLTNAEGIEALDTIIRKGIQHSFVGAIAYRSEYRNENLMQHGILPFRFADEIAEKLNQARSTSAADVVPGPSASVQAEHSKELNLKEMQLADIEQATAEIWKRSLGVHQIGLDDSFYALGGNSLIGMEIMLELSKRTGIQLNVAVLLEHETLRKLSLYLESTAKGHDSRPKMKSIPKAKTLS
ncbi:beta-ketoacyl synthase N-terminal-like domain-containing protein [Paenibacillus alvei]|uniref:beta-ketoacyl synthase N-terminal-like domain-containing protein n=1 Tax=Paenibacillus alvei TaxID=44250 RepID=UPI0013DC7162|nr:beta-ketoacyl synthase N-terminal-like domain-containing protein [Paenibacillus alvei]NEZ41835.1 KR domain-containing protein [Paenibacillus alvei]